jgi:subtilisin family serine protease
MSRPTQLRLAALAAFSGLAVLLAGGISAAAAPSTTLAPAAESRSYVPGELIVRFKPGSRAAARAAVLSNEGTRLERELRVSGTKLVAFPQGRSVTAVAAALERHSEVLYAEPNRIYHTSATPNDPRFPELWGLSQPSNADIDAPEAWDLQTGSSNVIVAIVDSGVAYDHPDIAPNRWVNDDPLGGGDNDGNGFVDDTNGWDFVDNDNTPIDEYGHGTHVAGTIGAQGNNGIGTTGVNWDVSLMPVRAADAWGQLTDARIADAFTYACRNGARVVNGSFGGAGSSQLMYDAIVAPACANTLFVFAAGNDGHDNGLHPQYPCNYHLNGAANVICVAATDRNDQLAGFSNYGASTVDLAAPGVDILSTVPAEQAVTPLDDFEVGGGWIPTGTWARTTEQKHSGSWSVTDSPGASYQPSSNTTLTRGAPLDLSGKEGCDVHYALRLDTELEADVIWLETSTDGGVTWSKSGGWTGSTRGDFASVEDSLWTVDGRPDVRFRYRLETNPVNQLDGAYIDDVVFTCLAFGEQAYAPSAGTSMAAPHVAGVAALLLAQSPSCSAVQLKAILNSSVDVLGSLAGKTITGGRLNARRALGSLPAACQAPAPPPPPPPPPSVLPPSPPAPAVLRCVVPKVKGRTLLQARSLLRSKRCTLGRVKRAYSAKVKKGKIISQARRPGVRLPRGTRVNVLISRGRRR